MSPIDDELRRTLHNRADHLAPTPDPLAGIETKARRMRRRQASASLAVAAVAVAAVAFAVPSLTSGISSPGPAQVAGSATPAVTATATASVQAQDPLNLLSWQPRGSVPPAADVEAVKHGFAAALSTPVDQVRFRALFSITHHGLTITVGQAWSNGQIAYNVGYSTGGSNGPELFIGEKTAMQTPVVAFVAAGAAGSRTDLLVLVPRPGTGQVSYSPDATSAFVAVASGRSDIDAVGLVDRDPKAQQDRVEILDGDGNLDKPLYRDGVGKLVCGFKECG